MSVTGVLEPSVAFEEAPLRCETSGYLPHMSGHISCFPGVLEKKAHVKLAFSMPVVFKNVTFCLKEERHNFYRFHSFPINKMEVILLYKLQLKKKIGWCN